MSAALIPVESLTEFCARCFERLGLAPEDARLTSEALVASNLRGVDSHGIIRLKVYADRLRAGGTRPHGQPSVVSEGPAFALLDGGGGIGQVISAKAMRLAIEKARATIVAVVGVRNSSHFGAAAFYGLMAVEEGMIGLAASNASPTMSPWGGSQKMLGNNPLCVAVPAGRERPVVLDMATGAVALGKILVAMTEGRRIPATWGFDKEWLPTEDPKAVIEGGAIQPLGGYKGYCLSMILDVLTGVLMGGEFATSIRGLYQSLDETQGVSHIFGALRVESFIPLEEFKQRMDAMIALLRGCARAPGAERVYVPGEIEDEIEIERRRDGIPINATLKAELQALARELGVASPFG
jgi:LDH2 family malate/lactate/ureidoglycolate dehydrogenase